MSRTTPLRERVLPSVDVLRSSLGRVWDWLSAILAARQPATVDDEPVLCTAYYTDGPHPSYACGLPADHWPSPHSWEGAQPATVDAETLAKVRALRPTGEREWRNQGRSGTTPTVDYRDLRAALASAVAPAPEGETGGDFTHGDGQACVLRDDEWLIVTAPPAGGYQHQPGRICDRSHPGVLCPDPSVHYPPPAPEGGTTEGGDRAAVNIMTDEEWAEVEAALVKGGLRQVIERIVIAHENDARQPATVRIGEKNRAIVYRAWDDGDGHTVTLELTDDHPWFRGMYEGHEVMLGCEYGDTLYSIVYASGGGLVSVIVGEGLVDNDAGTTFHSVPEAKAYVKGLASR